MRRKKDTLYTEFTFTFPKGLSDAEHRVHRHGVMRLATAKDDILNLEHTTRQRWVAEINKINQKLI